MKKKKQQRLTFVVEETTGGQMKVSMSFYPPLALTEEAFNKMPMKQREMQNKVSDLGRYVMERLAKQNIMDADRRMIDAAMQAPEHLKTSIGDEL